MIEVLDAVIHSAEATAAQASGNDKTDWNNFAKALRVAREKAERDEANAPKPTPHK
jgi:hypothetical protein